MRKLYLQPNWLKYERYSYFRGKLSVFWVTEKPSANCAITAYARNLDTTVTEEMKSLGTNVMNKENIMNHHVEMF